MRQQQNNNMGELTNANQDYEIKENRTQNEGNIQATEIHNIEY